VVSEQINDAIASIHTLSRRSCKGVGGRYTVTRTVQVAAIIVPYVPFKSSGDWKELDTPTVFFRDEYVGLFRFGAIVMQPGVCIAECRDLLESLLAMMPSNKH